jgi:hypothetical protein
LNRLHRHWTSCCSKPSSRRVAPRLENVCGTVHPTRPRKLYTFQRDTPRHLSWFTNIRFLNSSTKYSHPFFILTHHCSILSSGRNPFTHRIHDIYTEKDRGWRRSCPAPWYTVNFDDETQDEGGDLLDTPGAEKKRWGDGPETPVATRQKRTRASIGATIGGTKGSALTLRDQEKVGGHCSFLESIYIQIIITWY